MRNTKKSQKAYEFFCLAEKEDSNFSLDEVVRQTGWALSTVNEYKSKKWYPFLFDVGNGLYKCKGITQLPIQAFIKLHAQRVEIYPDLYRIHYGEMADIFIDKSREAAMLAVQIYNNPTVTFRTEGYIVNMIIAFTALFHAVFERDNIAYWHKDESGQPLLIEGDKKYWELSECLREYYKDKQSPEKENLKLCLSIRNKIEHRFYNTMDLSLSGYCQSLLMNYEKLLVVEFGRYFSLGGNHLALALQISSYDGSQNKVLNAIQSKYYDEIKNHIEDYRRKLPVEIVDSERFCFRAFLIPKIGNHESSSDISIEFVNYDASRPDEMEKYEHLIGLIKEKTIQVANQGKYLPGDVVKQIIAKGIEFTIQMHTKAWKLYKVRPKEKTPIGCNLKFCQFSEPHKNFIYTK